MLSTADQTSPAHDDSERNLTLLQAFEWHTPGGGTHWDWLRDNAERFADMGVTAVWIPPPTKAMMDESVGYDTCE